MLLKRAFSGFLYLGALCYISSCKSPSGKESTDRTTKQIDTNYVVGAEFGTDSVLNNLLEGYRTEKDLKMSRVLTRTKKGLTKERPQSELTNLMADVLFGGRKSECK